jgi:hypothetical protein
VSHVQREGWSGREPLHFFRQRASRRRLAQARQASLVIAMSPGGKIGEFPSMTTAEQALIAAAAKQKQSCDPYQPE